VMAERRDSSAAEVWWWLAALGGVTHPVRHWFSLGGNEERTSFPRVVFTMPSVTVFSEIDPLLSENTRHVPSSLFKDVW